MPEMLLPFFIFLLGLFLSNVSQYSSHYGEAYKLWIQEIVYDNGSININEELKSTDKGSEAIKEKAKITKEETELFGKIEYLMMKIESYADAMRVSFFLLNLSFIFLISDMKISLESIYTSNSSIFGNFFALKSGSLLISVLISTIFVVFFPLVNSTFKIVGIDLISLNKVVEIDQKLFDVWYKHRCFEYRCHYFNELKPKRFYEILAKKYESNEKTFDGKK